MEDPYIREVIEDLGKIHSNTPVLITMGEFTGDISYKNHELHNPDYGKVALRYYQGDDILVYENSHTHVPDIAEKLGYEWKNMFGDPMFEDEEIYGAPCVLVRNDAEQLYYSIAKDKYCYSDVELIDETLRFQYGPMEDDDGY